MAGNDNHITFLKGLAPPQRDRELRQELTDSLQELVAAVEPCLPQGGNTLHSCVIDDFEVRQVELGERDGRVCLRFSGSARQGVGGAASLERITGVAEAVIDDRGRVSYRDVRFAEEPTFVAHDVGGGD
jgi:hypothetical protein